jgi:hypothetical protein
MSMTDKDKDSSNDNVLVFNDYELVATYWPGKNLNEAEVELAIDTHRVAYDRDYGIEEKITGTYDLKRAEAEKLYYFLGWKFGFGATAG